MDDVTKQSILGALRTLLAAAGAWMATHKYIPADSANEIVGAVMIIIPILWSRWDKLQSERKTQLREVAAVNAGVAVAGTGSVGPTVRPVDVPEIIKTFSPTVVKPQGDSQP